ncbi:helix-turn-helix transcriptional regulator [Aquimarina celericrescens]|nr:helix-turn-helix transcriptional regulator [Aquimarina celericrescens]
MYQNLKQTLSFYGVACDKPYYISSGKSIFQFPENSFRMDFYSLCICTSGKMTMEIDGSNYLVQQNSFLISAPSTIVHFRKFSKDFKMKLLFFEKNFLLKNISNPFIIEKSGLFQQGSYSLLNAPAKDIEHILTLLDYLKHKTKTHGNFIDEIIRSIIFNILLEVAEITHRYANEPESKDQVISTIYLKFRKLVQEQILEHKTVQLYADQLHISNKYLIEIVKKTSGRTPHEVINEILLKEAYVLLGNPELTVTEIAFQLHFNSTSAFGRFFKKHTTISPSQYRTRQNKVR